MNLERIAASFTTEWLTDEEKLTLAQAPLTAMLEGFGGDGVTEQLRDECKAEWDHLLNKTFSTPMAVEHLAQFTLSHRQLSAAAERARTGWQPIETAPRDGTIILYSGQGGYVCAGRFVEGQWFEANNHPTDHWGGPDDPTHWMPLPAPPADAIERGEVRK